MEIFEWHTTIRMFDTSISYVWQNIKEHIEAHEIIMKQMLKNLKRHATY